MQHSLFHPFPRLSAPNHTHEKSPRPLFATFAADDNFLPVVMRGTTVAYENQQLPQNTEEQQNDVVEFARDDFAKPLLLRQVPYSRLPCSYMQSAQALTRENNAGFLISQQ